MNPRDRRSWIIFDILQVIERTGANRVDAKKKMAVSCQISRSLSLPVTYTGPISLESLIKFIVDNTAHFR
jgi:hypothetical protein